MSLVMHMLQLVSGYRRSFQDFTWLQPVRNIYCRGVLAPVLMSTKAPCHVRDVEGVLTCCSGFGTFTVCALFDAAMGASALLLLLMWSLRRCVTLKPE